MSDTKQIVKVCATPTRVGTMIIQTDLLIQASRIEKVRALEFAPEWLAGLIKWRETEIPLISLKAMNNDGVDAIKVGNPIVIIRDVETLEKQNYYAIPTLGLPQIVDINRKNMEIRPERKTLPVYSVFNVNLLTDDHTSNDGFLLDMSYMGEVMDEWNDYKKEILLAA